jgi:hypothetical protein
LVDIEVLKNGEQFETIRHDVRYQQLLEELQSRAAKEK